MTGYLFPLKISGRFVILFLIILIYISCEKKEKDIRPTTPPGGGVYYFQIMDIELETGSVVKEKFISLNNEYYKFDTVQSDNHEDAAVFLELTESVEITINSHSPSLWTGFISEAYATTPSFYAVNHLERISIYSSDTVHTNDEFYLPGEELKELFQVVISRISNTHIFEDIDELISFQDSGAPDLFLTVGEGMVLTLKDTTYIEDQTMYFDLFFDDSLEIKLITNDFNVKN